jgi:phosphatidate cytidylyltransferase
VSGTDLKIRATSGVAALAVVLPILIFGGFWWVVALAGLAAAWGLHEVVSMAMPEERNRTFPLLAVIGALFFMAAAWSSGQEGASMPDALAGLGIDITLVFVLVGMVLSATFFVLTARSTEGLADRWAHFSLGPAYVAAPLGLIPALSVMDGGKAWLWVPLLVAWFGDMGGYFAGRAFGKHKLLPLISPKKTWEGLAGGLLFSVGGLLAFKYGIVDRMIAADAPMQVLDCVVLGVVGALAGVVGDLTASMLKRSHGVKDSGRFLPGHGGMLDRIDALLFVVPVVWLWLVVLRPLVLG